MLTKEISEVEKGCGKLRTDGIGIRDGTGYTCATRLCPICQTKLSTLKSAQAKFKKFVEDLKKELKGINFYAILGTMGSQKVIELIDELSSKQEGKE